MKWAKYYLLIIDNDTQCMKNARYWINRYNIPIENIASSLPTAGFPLAYQDFLGKLDLTGKLIIVGHGNSLPPLLGGVIKRYSPVELVSFLRTNCGLREAGLVSFKACELGIGSFLYDFKEEMDMRSARFGGCVGYKGIARTTEYGDAIGVLDFLRKDVFFNVFGKNSDSERVTIVKGNTPIPRPYGNNARFQNIRDI